MFHVRMMYDRAAAFADKVESFRPNLQPWMLGGFVLAAILVAHWALWADAYVVPL